MKANIGITQKNLQEVALELNKALADEVVLYIKTRNYHWNVEGDSFMEMHKFYESQYEQIDVFMDDVAERIRFIGHYSEARLTDYLKLTHLSEPQYTTSRKEQLNNLLIDHEAIIMNLRGLITTLGEKYKDLGSADFVTGLMEKHEKMAWMIRSYLK
jgi:starvation-inducible DNA-binding protein